MRFFNGAALWEFYLNANSKRAPTEDLFGVFCYAAGCLGGSDKVYYFAPFQKTGGMWGREAESNTRGVREVGWSCLSTKWARPPELNPGDWKWIECISPYIDSRWHRGDSDRERVGVSQRVGRGMKKRSAGEAAIRAVVCYQLTTGAFQTPLLSHYTITGTEGSCFSHPAVQRLVERQAHWLPLLSIPTTSPRHRHQEMDTIGGAGLIPGWQEQEGIGFRRG